MTDLIEQLWPAFEVESMEQLEALELALLRGASEAGDVDALFRHFHTLKGSCAMMGFAAMESVAHACEDLLDPVRKGRRPLTPGGIEMLLSALDSLKLQLGAAAATRADTPAAPGLIERLRELAGDATPAVCPAVPAPPAEGLAMLAAIGRECVPALAASVLQAAALDAGQRAALVRLQGAAATHGAPALAELLAVFEGTADRRSVFADVLERLVFLEQESGLVAGVAQAAALLRRELEAELRAMAAAVRQPGPESLADGEGCATAMADLGVLLGLARLLALPHTTRVLGLALHILRECARGGVVADRELADVLAVAVALPLELLDGLEEDVPYVAMCAQVIERLQAVVAARSGQDSRPRVAALRERIDIAEPMLAALGTEALARLEAAVAAGDTIVEIEADLESATDAGQGFVDWLAATGILLSNRTLPSMPGDPGLRLAFLAALPLPPDEIAPALEALRPAPRRLSLNVCARRGAAAAEAAPSGAIRAAPAPASGAATLRVSSSSVDAFVSRIGEMVTLRNAMAHAIHGEDVAVRQARALALLDERAAAHGIGAADVAELREFLGLLERQRELMVQADVRLQGTLSRLQEEALALRVVPIALVFNRLPRVVHDLGQSLGRQVRLDVSGEDVRIDKGMVEVLSEPLLHLVRNAVDHGLEAPAQRRAAGKPAEAVLAVSASQHGNSLLVEVRDDGRGLDRERIRAQAQARGLVTPAEAASLSEREVDNLIFLPGFSTATEITGVSGRGVGMDVVKTRVLQLGGQVEVRSVAGRGTSFTLRLPLSAAIQSVILVEAGGRQLAIPERSVAEVISLPAASLQAVQGQACSLLRGVVLPLYHLAVLLGNDAGMTPAGEMLQVVVLSDGIYRIGLVVERVLGRPEVFLREVHPDLARLPGVGGASVLGDGRVVIILDCDSLFDLALRRAQSLRSLLRAS